jgi:uncharacterized membrane protein YpjA
LPTPDKTTIMSTLGPVRTVLSAPVPDTDDLPWYVAPLPRALENFGLRLAWLIVLINLAGTAFGFYYYRFQFSITPTIAWPVVPDSPVATLFIALSLALWKLGRNNEYVNALAFFGCLKLGTWTPYVLLVFYAEHAPLHWAMYHFLLWSHLAMVLEGFLIHRYSDFPVPAVFLAVAWYTFNDVVDYFIPIEGTPTHTLLPRAVEPMIDGRVQHISPGHELAAAGAVVITVLATFLAMATRVEKMRA